MELHKPPRLVRGATIGVVNPSYWMDEEQLQFALTIFEKRGYKIIRGASTRLKYRQYAGTPEARADDLLAMFRNPDVDAIICARGGYGANRVLPLLDYDLIKTHPKIFMGYSDITGYLTSISQQTNLITFHGPMMTTFKTEAIDYNLDTMETVLSGTDDTYTIFPPDELPPRILREGLAEGPLWGGNMSLLLERLSTPEELITDGCILFLEEVDEYLYAFDRLMLHLKNSGALENIRGLIMGELVNMKDQKTPFAQTTDEIIMDVCRDFSFPIITNFPCGHGRYQATLPISCPVRLNADENKPALELLESPVIH